MSPDSNSPSAPARSPLFATPSFLPGQRRLLQKIATGAALEESLELLIQLIEAEVPGVSGIVLMLAEDGKSLSFTAGANVHPVLREAARRLPVGEGFGTCSAAVARRERVGAPDLATWPMSTDFADVFARSGVRATWSQPFYSSKGDVLGTLCLLYRAPGRPEPREIDLIETAAHLAALAVERERLDRVRRLQAITFEILSEALIVADDEGRIIDCNQAAERMWGWKREELLGQSAAILYPPEARDRMSSEVLDTVRRVGRWSGERPWLAKDGRRGWREVTVLRLRDQGGREVGFIGVNRDITERKRAEHALRDAHQRLDYHVENSPLGFIEWGRDFQVMRWSPQAERIFGWKAEEVLGKSPMDWRLIYEEDLPGALAAMERLTSGTEPRLVHANRNWTRDGRLIHCVWHNSVLTDEQGGFVSAMSLVLDVTEQVRAQEEREKLSASMLQTQKLESLGILAGGLAHDFNNLLTGMLGNAELISDKLPPDHPVQSWVRAIVQSASRAADLTRQMLAYSGKATFEVAPLDLSAEVREISELLSSSIPKKVALVFDLDRDLPAIEADRAQIQQLAMNLVINAAEASGESVGRVEISAGQARLSAGELGWRFPADGPPAGDYVTLQVRDNGCGMDEATMERMFDPFFTTKFTGRGLGLAAVLGIVRAHRAALKVESRPGQGTRFRVLFPVSPKRVAPAVEQRPPRAGGSACVLVIDDEPLVLDMASAALEHQGFVALLAASGEEGVARFRERADGIDVVLLDMTLPRMGGEEVLRELRALRSDVRVILTSGYSELEAARHVPLAALAGFLQKPYSPRTLAAKVRAALDPT